MPSPLMQCSKIADEPKNDRSRPGSKFSDRALKLSLGRRALVSRVKNSLTFSGRSLKARFRGPALSHYPSCAVPQPDLQMVGGLSVRLTAVRLQT
jgi:hypothetical protein